MDHAFLGVPNVDVWLFSGLALAAFLATLVGILSGAAGGLITLAVLALFFPPAVLIPLHTLVQLGAGTSRAFFLRHFVVKSVLLPFTIGAAAGAFAGAQIFISLPTDVLQGILALFILSATWMPGVGRLGPEKGRYALLGFGATFLGVFVSATGTLVAPVLAASIDDRRAYAGTFGLVMCIVHIAKVAAFGALGIAIGAYAPLILVMIGAAVVANWCGSRYLDRMKESNFRIALRILLTALALRLLWVAIRDFVLV
jgi:uncharacterized membrane protein YfcA